MAKRKHKYKIKCKVRQGTGKAVIYWWNSSNLLSFVRFLDSKYPDWKWFNVWKRDTFKMHLPNDANFTKNNRPINKNI